MPYWLKEEELLLPDSFGDSDIELVIFRSIVKIPRKGDNGFGRNGVLNIPKCMVLEIRYQKVLSFPAYMMESDHVNAWNP